MKNKYLRHARISEREFRAIFELFSGEVPKKSEDYRKPAPELVL
jgi:hypothetical protein